MQALTPVDEVIDTLIARASVVEGIETVGISEALGRVLAADVMAAVDVPSFANSSMDGYACRAEDVESGGSYAVSARITAGHPGGRLLPGTLARIFTGAPLPDGADAVVIQENTEIATEAGSDKVTVRHQPRTNDNVRPRGQDITAGSVILERGRRLRPQDIALAASTGCDQLSVYRRLRVGVLATGDELIDPPAPLAPGQIYNSNHYGLLAMLTDEGFDAHDLGRVEDDLDATRERLSAAARELDCVITSGGVSVGEADHVRDAVAAMGAIDIWRLAIKPGKPLAFGNVQGTAFFGLPGNPVSTFVTFRMIALPYLLRCQGLVEVMPQWLWATADFSWTTQTRREYLRVRLSHDGAGNLRAEAYPEQGSGVMSSVCWADALAMVDVGETVGLGEPIRVYPLSWAS